MKNLPAIIAALAALCGVIILTNGPTNFGGSLPPGGCKPQFDFDNPRCKAQWQQKKESDAARKAIEQLRDK